MVGGVTFMRTSGQGVGGGHVMKAGIGHQYAIGDRENRLTIAQRVVDSYYSPPSDLLMVRGEGVYLYDIDGQGYIDCASGTFNLTLGYSHPDVVRVIRNQAENLIHVTSKFQTTPLNELVSRLIDVSPPNLSRVHLKSSSGSDANESAVKIAQHYTGNPDVITLFRSHLGQTMSMIGASGAAFRRTPFVSQFPGVLHVPDPYCLRCFYGQQRETSGLMCVERINDLIDYASSGRIACLMLEPISGNGGNIVPPEGYLQALKTLCEERQILLVFDEIQTGFGRTGQMFAADYFGVSPNLMTFGKGLGGSGMPIAGILAEERLVGLEGYHMSSTFGGNVLSAAVAAKTLEVITRPGFLQNVRSVGAYVMERLRDLEREHPFIVDVRGAGLMIGIEIADEDGNPNPSLTNHLANEGMRFGLLLRTSLYGFGNVVKVRPPLIMTLDEAGVMCDRLERLFRSAQ
jgi:4-aminobutyrate aminotransferase-like enzyme